MVIWQHYESLTTTLAQELCEQLRMVLAPTLAAKFKYVLQMNGVELLSCFKDRLSNWPLLNRSLL